MLKSGDYTGNGHYPTELLMENTDRETLDYDVLIVGAGPAGLAAALRLAQSAHDAAASLRICVLEKGPAVGAHILSGAVIDPMGLDELIPDWRKRSGFAFAEAGTERYLALNEETATPIPAFLLPPMLRQRNCILASLGDICHWLGQEAEKLGVDICAGFAGVEPLIENHALTGVITSDMGRDRDGNPKPGFTPGVAIRARYTLIAEGARGSLAQQLESRFALAPRPQKYALGLKELWQLDPARHQPGLVIHATGWPLDKETQGGTFLYHMPGGMAAVGLVVHLDYRNPYLSPFGEFQRAKTHPALSEHLMGGKRLGFGARALSCGGAQSIPKLVFPGGALLGCAASLLNPARNKGIHGAMLSGIAAADAAFAACLAHRQHDELSSYPEQLMNSRLWDELTAARNFKAWQARRGKGVGAALAGAELWAAQLGIHLPWTIGQTQADHETLRSAHESTPIHYPQADGSISFDQASSLHAAGVMHEENQPSHLRLKDPARALDINMKNYDSPETRYCPAGVYEIIDLTGKKQLQIHASNCLHCKTCDIKDPGLNIVWTPPEDGGPNYRSM